VTPDDPTLPLPELPLLAEPLGSLDAGLAMDLDPAGDAAFTVAGRRAWVTGGASRGIDHVVATPTPLAAGPWVAGARCERAVLTPLGLERRLAVDGAVVVERVAVPRDGRLAVLEWLALDGMAMLTISWVVPSGAAAAEPTRWRWRCADRGLVVSLGDGSLAAFVSSAIPTTLTVEPVTAEAAAARDAARDAAESGAPRGAPQAGLRVQARVAVPAGSSVRLALVAGAGGTELERGLRAAGRSRALVQGRRGVIEQLRSDRLSVITPEPALDRALEWVEVRLADRLTDSPAAGRSIVTGREAGRAAYVTADAVRAALDGLVTGDFDLARDVLSFLRRHQHGSGRIPAACGLDAIADHGTREATLLYFLLAARYLDAAGDVAFLQGEGSAIRRAWAAVREPSAGSDDDDLRQAALHGLSRAAEAIGDLDVAAETRGARDATGEAGPAATAAAPASHDPTGVVPFLRGLLGPEPDAVRGRMVLRPRPPTGWAHFQATSLAMGDARFTLAYRRQGRIHRFTVRQDRGASPVRLILEPELPGRLLAARVDGHAAELTSMETAHGTRVPVQLALDHERTVELRMEEVRGGSEGELAGCRTTAGGKTETPGG
jgi:hypothetical protein